jgi:hypothetical protein
MNINELMSILLKHYRGGDSTKRTNRHSLDGMECVTAPSIEASSYEFMLENLMDPPTERFDRWRNRMPQG